VGHRGYTHLAPLRFRQRHIVGIFPDDGGNALAKISSELIVTHGRILNDVVEKGGNGYVEVAPIRRLNHKIENFDEVIYVGLLRSPFAPLVAMCFRSEQQGLRQATKISTQSVIWSGSCSQSLSRS
jgi:hypothetical protein